MNECACNSTSQHNGKDSLLYRLCLDSSREGVEDIVLVIRGVDVLWTAGESLLRLAIFSLGVVWLMIMADRSTYLRADRAITFTEEDPLTLESDWYQWTELTSSSTIQTSLWALIIPATLS